MRLLRTWPPTRTGYSTKPQIDTRNQLQHTRTQLRTLITKLALTSIVLALCSAPASSMAASAKVSLNGKTTAIAGTTYKVTAHIAPNRSGVGMTLLLGTKGIRHAQTNAQGNATFLIKLAKDATLRAKVTNAPTIKSTPLSVAVFHRTTLNVDWPTYTLSCTNETVDVFVSPAIAGRTVTMQYQNNGAWVNEDIGTTDRHGYVRLSLSDNSNTELIGTTMASLERIVVSAKGRYLATSDTTTLEYEGCGDGTSTAEILDGYYNGNAVVGGSEDYSWDLTNADPTMWVGGTATVVMDVCDADTRTCQPASDAMSHMYQDTTAVHGNDSGSFIWVPATSGNYVVRLSLWNDGQMITWVAQTYAISN